VSLDPEGLRIIAERNGVQFGALVNTPGQILNEMDSVDRLVDGLGVAVNQQRAKLGKTVVKQFEAFWNEWKAFYVRNKGLGARLWGGTWEQTIGYRDRATQWQERLGKAGAEVTPDRITPPDDGSTTKILKYIGIGTAVLVGLFIAGKLVHTIVLGRSGIGTLGAAEAAAVALMDAQRRRRRR
jgi:hypothetical protein